MAFNPQPKKTKKDKPKKRKVSFKGMRDKCLKKAQRNCKIRWQVETKNTSGLVQCISCGSLVPIASIQGGHFISRQNRATEVEEDNIHPQCATCNVLKKGNYLAYEYALKAKYGNAYVERLKNMALAREGNKDAFEKLSASDKSKVLEKHTAKWYEAECERLDEEYRVLTDKYKRLGGEIK